MTRYFLAIPGVGFLFCMLLSPSFAQTAPDTSSPQAPSASATPAQSAPLSTEDLARLYLVRKEYREADFIPEADGERAQERGVLERAWDLIAQPDAINWRDEML